jgi:radical SAM superfamily enzyme YgiQ (UPF0313 family)
MFSPPSERLPHVIRLELTTGCSWGRCTYCEGYDGVPHRVKPFEEYKEHVDEVFRRIDKRWDLRRVFIGGGNALEVGTEELSRAIDYTRRKFRERSYNHNPPRRISAYGRTEDIITHGREGLNWLYNFGEGLIMIYWGAETGSSGVLRYIKKGDRKDKLEEAAEIVRSTGIETSVMIMPGAGGIKFYEEHMKETARILGRIKPKFITFMGINPGIGTEYYRRMAEEEKAGTNRPLTDYEIATQTIGIIEKMLQFNTKVGMFGKGVDAVGNNPLNFNFRLYADDDDKDFIITDLRRELKRKVEVGQIKKEVKREPKKRTLLSMFSRS